MGSAFGLLCDTADLQRGATGPRHGSVPGRWRVILVIAAVLSSVSGCDRATGEGKAILGDASPSGVPSTPAGQGGAQSEGETRARAWLDLGSRLPSRAEVVALADQLAIQGERAPKGGERARLLRIAGDLRARTFRVAHADADAREALELYAAVVREALRVAPEEACGAAMAHAALAAEMAHDPALYYREAYVASKLFSQAACAPSLEGVLRELAVFRPANDVLSELEQEATRQSGEAARGDKPAATPQSSSSA